MNILIYTSKFPPLTGGVEEVTKNLALKLNTNNSVLVITSYNLRSKTQSIFNKLLKGLRVAEKGNYNGVSTLYVFMSLPRSIFGFISFPFRFVLSVIIQRRVIKKFKPTVINAHFLDDSLIYFYLVTLFKKTKIVLDIHGNELHVFSKNRFYRFIFKKILNKSFAIIVHSTYMKEELLKRYKVQKNIEVIPNSVDLTKFNSKNNSVGNYYLFVGRLDYKKGIDVLIKAYRLVSNKVTRKLIIIGGSSGEKKHGSLELNVLKNEAKGLNIEFLGRVDNNDIKGYYQNAYYSIFPSRHEPFGIVALESVACGTPFVASSGGFKEIAKKTEAGIIFKEGFVKNLSNLLLKIDKDVTRRNLMSKKGLVNIKKYSLELFVKHYYNVLNK